MSLDSAYERLVNPPPGDRLQGSLAPVTFNHQSFTYVTVGNGVGEVETITYRQGGAAGNIVAVVTFTYDGSNRLATAERTT